MSLKDPSHYLKEARKSEKDADGDPLFDSEANYYLWSYHHALLKKRKISHYVKEAFAQFSKMVGRIIKSGVMNRLFSQFDFFSMEDRDPLSPRSAHLRKKREMPVKCRKRKDQFGDVKWDFSYLDNDSDSEDSFSSNS